MTTYDRYSILDKNLRSLLTSLGEISNLKSAKVFLADAGQGFVPSPELERLQELHENVEICVLRAPNTYWAQGMRIAWLKAQQVDFDFIIWLNEDVKLSIEGLKISFAELSNLPPNSIIVGSTVNSRGEITYGKLFKRFGLGGITFSREGGVGSSGPVATFHGNFVLMSREVDMDTGGFPSEWTHARADLAKGLLATGLGYKIVETSQSVGLCELNPDPRPFELFEGLSLPGRLKLLNSPKIGPLVETLRFNWSFGGWLKLYFVIGSLVAPFLPRRLLKFFWSSSFPRSEKGVS